MSSTSANSRVSVDCSSLENNIYLYEPGEEARAQSAAASNGTSYTAVEAEDAKKPPTSIWVDAPSLIILCTWQGGATTSRIAKYTSWYREHYSSAYVLLIRTVFVDMAARSFTSIRARLQPAREAIIRILGDKGTPATPDVLLHNFSHGGCNTAVQLAKSIYQEAGSLLHVRLRQVIFDSCPGDATFDKAYNAALVSLPRPLMGTTIGAAAAYSAVSVITALQNAGLVRSVVHLRQDLNDPVVFGTRARRLYMVSHGDRMVAVEDVLSHATEGRTSGYEVGVATFGKAPHCGLILEDAERYWGAIRDAWDGKELPTAATEGHVRPAPRL